MKEYQRTTRECAFSEFSAEIREAVGKYVAANEMEAVEAELIMCVETSSEKIKRGVFSKLFGGNYTRRTAVLLMPGRILWCTLDNKNRMAVLSARLSEVEIRDFSSEFIEDSGLDVFGFLAGSAERVSAFIGLGSEPAAQKFREAAKELAARAKSK